mgnify:CR=1 FL=1
MGQAGRGEAVAEGIQALEESVRVCAGQPRVGEVVGICPGEAKGLVQRVVLPHDRRSVRVSLTAAGQALYEELMPQVQSINARILEVLDPAQKEALDAILQQLRLQARRLLAEMDPQLPKADRRRGGRKDT